VSRIKIGYGEIIATVALLISALSLWFAIATLGPDVSVRDLDHIELVDPARPHLQMAAFPLMITNHGGRGTSLVQITEADMPPAFRVRIGEMVANDATLELHYLIFDEVYNDLEELKSEMSSTEFQRLSLPQVLNISLPDGTSRALTLVVLIVDSNGESIAEEAIAFACQLLFADGTTHRVGFLSNHDNVPNSE